MRLWKLVISSVGRVKIMEEEEAILAAQNLGTCVEWRVWYLVERLSVSQTHHSEWMNMQRVSSQYRQPAASRLFHGYGWFFLAPTSILQVQEESIFLQYTSLLPWQSTSTMLVSYLASSGLGSPLSSTVGAHPTEPPLYCRRHGCLSSTCGYHQIQ